MEYLIADSGGSKTDWCHINALGVESFFETESYHPHNWSPEFFKNSFSILDSKMSINEINLHFFGAGCLNQENAITIKSEFQKMGFGSVKVKSDIEAAGLALFGFDRGVGAILGTGSVVFNWANRSLIEVQGGKGHLVGDEGSGYYFGKLILDAYHQQSMTIGQVQLFESHCLANDDFDDGNKYKIASIAHLLHNYSEIFLDFHVRNCRLFCNAHPLIKKGIQLKIIGSYAYHHRSIFEKEFGRIGITSVQFMSKPIETLVEQKVLFID